MASTGASGMSTPPQPPTTLPRHGPKERDKRERKYLDILRDSIKIRSWILRKFLGIYGKFRDTCKNFQEIPRFNGILSDFSQEFVVLSGILSRFDLGFCKNS